jgi:hypothetical protein
MLSVIMFNVAMMSVVAPIALGWKALLIGPINSDKENEVL